MKVADVRLTLYALVSSIEQDLRSFLRQHVLSQFEGDLYIKAPELREKVRERFLKDFPGMNPLEYGDGLLDYLDFLDSYQLLQTHVQLLPGSVRTDLERVSAEVPKMVPIRNRIMHGRPLLVGDFGDVYGFVCDVTQSGSASWDNCASTIKQLETDPGSILSLNLPTSDSEEAGIFHNLPMPDFDETGFVGRSADVHDLKKLLLGPNRVVSLIGEGGVGKTALMLKVVYDILDLGHECPFQIMIWVSTKTTVLTAAGVQEIRDAIRDYSGVIDEVSQLLGVGHQSLSENVADLMEYLKTFRCLLVLDNFETVIGEEIRSFVFEAQEHCKIAITSRVGLGELEIRRPLGPMRLPEAENLFRSVARITNTELLYSLPSEKVKGYLTWLHCNPLHIKWFVHAVSAGRSPAEVFEAKGNVLDFCLANVYGDLTENEHLLLDACLAARSPVCAAELIYFSELSALDVRRAINGLLATSLICRRMETNQGRDECIYALTDLAREFVLRNHPPSRGYFDRITKKKRELVGSLADTRSIAKNDEFSPNALLVRTSTEKVVVRLLKGALSDSRGGRIDEAMVKVEEARRIAPDYFEVHRVSAFINAFAGNVLGAEEDYKRAIEVEPDNPRLLYFYAGFLLWIDDPERAIVYSDRAFAFRKDSPAVAILCARCKAFAGQTDEAIAILVDLLDNGKGLMVKYKKITCNLLMSFYRRQCETELNVKRDIVSALSSAKSALRVFENARREAIVDMRLIEELGRAFGEYLQCLRTLADVGEQEKYEQALANYRPFLERSRSASRLFSDLAQDTFGAGGSAKALLARSGMRRGTVSERITGKPFAFISGLDGMRYYVNKSLMKDVEDWERVRNGVLLQFLSGQNEKGLHAVEAELFPTGQP